MPHALAPLAMAQSSRHRARSHLETPFYERVLRTVARSSLHHETQVNVQSPGDSRVLAVLGLRHKLFRSCLLYIAAEPPRKLNSMSIQAFCSAHQDPAPGIYLQSGFSGTTPELHSMLCSRS
ncbi:hypothetical protein V8C34DRAFT_270155 [Trichoderma compactum]